MMPELEPIASILPRVAAHLAAQHPNGDTMTRFTARPFEVEAIRWTGKNIAEMDEFINDGEETAEDEPIGLELWNGKADVQVGDWVVKGWKISPALHTSEFAGFSDEDFRVLFDVPADAEEGAA